ncbi:MAG: sugar phosphate isomerase/epimerase [Candidatus Hydrogenedentes bacterium]|nr:sugar phosphate isomerase/epimerase [Candidatus Hydrogenedentota bacterium]
MRIQTAEQIGVCSWSLKATGAADLTEKVKALGLKRVQIGLTPHRDDPGAWEGVQEMMAESGIRIVSGMFSTLGEDYTTPETIRLTGGVVLDEYWGENLALAEAAAALARKMGLDQVSAHAGFLPHEPSDPGFEQLSGRLGQLAGIFGAHGIQVLLETGQESAQTLLAFLNEMRKRGVRNLAVNFDPANMLLYDMGEPIGALRLLAPQVRQVHVKDARRPAVRGQWGEEVVVGTGEVDWVSFVRILAESDFDGSYIFEREAGEDRIGDITRGVETLRGAMETVAAE